MIKTWYNIRSGYIIHYFYDTEKDILKISKQPYQRIKNIENYVIN